ncbi:MAG: UDP-N-acetylglucosamine diphosphorylase [Parachlamydiaceae bacterium]
MKELTAPHLFDLSTFRHATIFQGLNYVWEVLAEIETFLNKQKLGTIEGQVLPGAFLVDPHLISIGQGTIVEPGAYIKGPCLIGKNCSIRHGAYIRGNLITGDNCVIGHDSEIKNSLFLDGAHAPHFAYVGDSVLGNRVNLGAGTVCANLRFDRKNVVVHYLGQTIETGRHKFGAIFGDDSQTGCNSVTNPGTIFDKNVYCLPTTNIGGVVSKPRL